MGRVYNALVRADKVKEGDRPIGSPNPRAAARSRGGEPVIARSATTVQTPFENNVSQIENLRTGKLFVAPGSVQAANPGFGQQPVLLPARRPIDRTPVCGAPIVVFEEPVQVSNIQDLAIDPLLAALTGEDGMSVERYRTLAVKLLNLADRRKLKTLLITSAEAGEGKTSVATGVAWALSKHPQRRVLLIDASPNASSVGRILGIGPKRGWLNLVERSCELKDAIVRIDPNGLYVMTPGTAIHTRSIGAMSSSLEDLIGGLASRFDMVIVDSPAILESPEAQRLGAILDGSVIVARAGYTHHARVTAARKLVPKERRLGVVLNEAEAGAEVVSRRTGKSSLVGRLFGRNR